MYIILWIFCFKLFLIFIKYILFEILNYSLFTIKIFIKFSSKNDLTFLPFLFWNVEIKVFYLFYLHESVRRISIPLKVSSSFTKKRKNISIPVTTFIRFHWQYLKHLLCSKQQPSTYIYIYVSRPLVTFFFFLFVQMAIVFRLYGAVHRFAINYEK